MAKKTICMEEKCTLCMACANICPKDAITIGVGPKGYEIIQIDSEKCVNCNLCDSVCLSRRQISRTTPESCYAGQAKDKNKLLMSASGGAFQMIADMVLKEGGVCYGCHSYQSDGEYHAKHLRITTHAELPLILNSKYIPSIIGDTYRQAKSDLINGKQVLFSGTPCQIEGLKSFLCKDYKNLLTVDLICHGITSTQMFNDYIQAVEEANNITIVDYLFRDKSVSWGTNFCYSYYQNSDPTKKVHVKHCPREASSYMIHYLRGNIFRENCYTCTLANTNRVSDFTLGDYWEIESEHPEFVTKRKPPIVLRHGVSCIMANNSKADEVMNKLQNTMILHRVSLDSIVAHNGNLSGPSLRGKHREEVLEKYSCEGYATIEKEYLNTVGKKMKLYNMKNLFKNYLPDRIRILIYRTPILRKLFFH